MSLLGLLVMFVASAIVAILLRPKIKDKSSPGDFRPPEPREGEPIPVVFGTALVSPSVTWFGDVHAKKVKKTVSSVFGLVKDTVPLGYDYYAGMQLVLCHGPIDALLDIYIGEHRVVRRAKYVGEGTAPTAPEGGWPEPAHPSLPQYYAANPTRLSLNLPKLFGGPEEGGGIVGQMDIHWGSNVQGPNDYLAVFWGVDILPHYRNLAYVVLRRMNMGKSPSPQVWKCIVKRIPNVLEQEEHSEIGDGTANVAEIIYELLTNEIWGLGKPASDIDMESFRECGETLSTEGLGYSGVLTDKSEAWEIIKNLLNHVNGVVYQDPTTGLIAMKLIRNDYQISELVELDETNCVIEEYKRGSWAETVNETAIQFTDVARRFSSAVAQAQNLAAIQAMDGEIISNTISLPGLTTHALALDAAERSNRVTSIPLIRFRVRTNRIAYAFHQGKPFKLTYPEYSLDEVVCRVASVNYGSLVEGTIEIDAVQDPWDLSGNAYASPDDLSDLEPCGPLPLLVTGYDPADDPSADYGIGITKVFEVPYFHVGDKGRVWVHQSRMKASDVYWQAWVSYMGLERTEDTQRLGFHATGYLEEELDDTGVAMTNITLQVFTAGEMDLLTGTNPSGRWAGDRLLMIDDEIMAWETITDLGDGLYEIGNVMRAQLDTVPEYHYQTARVFFYHNEGNGDLAVPYDVSSPNNLSPFTRVDVWPVVVGLDETSQNVDNVTSSGVMTGDRGGAPYPPGNVQINGYAYDAWPSTTTGDVTLSWSQRSRTEQTTMVAQDDPTNYTLEGTIKVEVLIDGVWAREWTGITTTSQVYTYAQRVSDDDDPDKQVQFVITPIGSGSEVGNARTTPPFIMDS